MISSMTGYGRGEVTQKGVTAIAEVRTVNNRYLEVTARLPRKLSLRENEIREVVRKKINRGKINVAVTLVQENGNDAPLKINTAAVKTYYKLLNSLRKSVKIKDKITLDHLLKFSEVLQLDEFETGDEQEWRWEGC